MSSTGSNVKESKSFEACYITTFNFLNAWLVNKNIDVENKFNIFSFLSG